MEKKHPNVIYILADDQGYGDMSCFNEDSKIKTPHFDRMAGEGMIFLDAHSSSAVCTPSRYSILTGRYNWRSALKSFVLMGNSGPLIENGRKTVADMLKSCGYNTACVGKWHLGWEWGLKEGKAGSEDKSGDNQIKKVRMEDIDYGKPIKGGPCDHGFDRYFGIAASLDMAPYVYIEDFYPTMAATDHYEGDTGKRMARSGPIAPDFKHIDVLPKITEKTLSYIEEFSQDDKPFYIYFPLPAPHTPILPTEEFQGKSGTNEYGDFVLMCDDVVGQVRNKLDELGILDNTILVYTSDNGCSPQADFDELADFGHFPSYHFRGHKADIYEGGHRIPLIIQWPEVIKAGSVCHETTCLVDFTATMADIVGYEMSDDMGEDSVSNLGLWQGGKSDKSLREATVHHSINGSFSIRKGEWKLEFCPGSGGWSYPKPDSDDVKGLPLIQLYNLNSDIGEQANLQGKHPEIVAELTSLMAKYVREGRSTSGKPQQNTGAEYWPQLAPFLRH
jgi:arylsulfatase A